MRKQCRRNVVSRRWNSAYFAAFRPPAVPLVVNNPYLSVWSEANNLTDDVTREWTGTAQPLISLIKIDGQNYRLMGTTPSTTPAFPQTGLQVTPTRSIYEFDDGHVHVTMTFMTPALPNNLDVLSRPLTYINWAVSSVDGQTHNVSIYESSSSLLSTTSNTQTVQWSRSTDGPLTALQVGTTAQTLLQPAGDQIGIDWGYLYAAAQTAQSAQSAAGSPELISQFQLNGLQSRDDNALLARLNTMNRSWPSRSRSATSRPARPSSGTWRSPTTSSTPSTISARSSCRTGSATA